MSEDGTIQPTPPPAGKVLAFKASFEKSGTSTHLGKPPPPKRHDDSKKPAEDQYVVRLLETKSGAKAVRKVSAVQKENFPTSCSICDTEPAELVCLDCSSTVIFALCANDAKGHAKIPVSRNHRVVSRDLENIHELLPAFCSTHAEQKCDYFCMQCSEVICRSCLNGVHRLHDRVVTIEEAQVEKMASISALITATPKVHDDLLAIVDRTNLVKKMNASKVQECSSDIDSCFELLHSQLEKIRLSLHRKLEDVSSKKDVQLRKFLDTILISVSVIGDVQDPEGLAVKNPSKWLEKLKTWKETWEVYEKIQSAGLGPEQYKFDSTFVASKSPEEILESVVSFCDLESEDQIDPSRCLAQGPGLQSFSWIGQGRSNTFTVTSCDRRSNPVSRHAPFEVKLLGPKPFENPQSLVKIEFDKDSGTTIISYDVPFGDTVEIDVTLRGIRIQGSPFFVSRKPSCMFFDPQLIPLTSVGNLSSISCTKGVIVVSEDGLRAKHMGLGESGYVLGSKTLDHGKHAWEIKILSMGAAGMMFGVCVQGAHHSAAARNNYAISPTSKFVAGILTDRLNFGNFFTVGSTIQVMFEIGKGDSMPNVLTFVNSKKGYEFSFEEEIIPSSPSGFLSYFRLLTAGDEIEVRTIALSSFSRAEEVSKSESKVVFVDNAIKFRTDENFSKLCTAEGRGLEVFFWDGEGKDNMFTVKCRDPSLVKKDTYSVEIRPGPGELDWKDLEIDSSELVEQHFLSNGDTEIKYVVPSGFCVMVSVKIGDEHILQSPFRVTRTISWNLSTVSATKGQISVLKDGTAVTCIGSEGGYVLGTKTLGKGRHFWQVRIEKMGSLGVIIGICSEAAHHSASARKHFGVSHVDRYADGTKTGPLGIAGVSTLFESGNVLHVMMDTSASTMRKLTIKNLTKNIELCIDDPEQLPSQAFLPFFKLLQKDDFLEVKQIPQTLFGKRV